MNTGKMRDRVTLEERVQTKDSMGAQRNAWGPIATVWGQVQPLSGREYFAAGAEQSEITARIRIRYRPRITAAHRAVVNGVVYSIANVIDTDNRHVELQLMCYTGSNDG